VDDQVEQYVEQWKETVEMRTSLTLRPITPLRRLLAEYPRRARDRRRSLGLP
jgi:hypothetical protein